jgi:microcystin-dependent protein
MMLFRRLCAAPLALALFLLAVAPARPAQDGNCLPTTGTLAGLTLVQDLNGAFTALFSTNSGASAPTDPCTATSPKGMLWVDTSVTMARFRLSDGAQWLTPGWIDAVNHLWVPQTGGGAINTVASAGTTDLCSTNPTFLQVSGTITITSFGSNCQVGQEKIVQFTGALTLTYNAVSLILPNGGNNITTAAGDIARAVYLGAGNWLVISYVAATGAPLSPVSAGTIQPFAGFTPPPGFLFANGAAVSRATYVALFGTICISEPGSRTNGSPIITGLASTSNMAPGMPLGGTGWSGAAVLTVDSGTQIHATVNASSTATSTVDVCPYGIGDGATTFNLPDLRGRTLPGVDGMGSSLTNRMNGCANSATLGSGCGAQSYNIAQNQLPNVAPTGAFAGTPQTVFTNDNVSKTTATFGAGSFAGGSQPTSATSVTFTPGGAVTVGSINGNVSQQAMNVLNPAQLVNYIIKY